MSKTVLLMVVVAMLIVLCAVQQVFLMQKTKAVPTASTAPLITYDIQSMAKLLVLPEGATETPSVPPSGSKFSELSGESMTDVGFDGSLSFDSSNVKIGRAADSRECRVAEIGWYYAKLIAAALPQSYIERSTPLAQAVEAGSLHSVFVVRHPAGRIVVAAGCYAARDGKGISDHVKVTVMSMNDGSYSAWRVGG